MNRIRIGIAGYGNLGRGAEIAVASAPDMDLVAVFTRRDPQALRIQTPNVPVLALDRAASLTDKIDVMIICGGSAKDLPVMTPELVANFNVIDSYDNHSKISDHYHAVDAVATATGHLGLISAGWDPGLFSLNRLYAESIYPQGKTYTFWGKGVSQGHSDAIRRIPGVLDARQYTVPIEDALSRVRGCELPELTIREKHTRECFVVTADDADRATIETQIKTMPGYFADYDTTVHFISAEELKRDHSGLPHGGSVIRTGYTGMENEHSYSVEYNVHMDSNPEFTGAVLVAYARAIHRMNQRGVTGCKTVLDIAVADLSPLDPETLRKSFV